MLTISMCLQWIWSDFGKKTTRRLSLLVMLFILTLFFASVDNRCKLFICPKALRWSLFYVLSCYGQISGSSGFAFYRLAGSNSRLLKSTDSKTVSTTECLYLLYRYHVISKGYRPEARGYVIYSPRALPEGAARGQRTRGINHITTSWRPINGLFLHWRGFLKECKNTLTKNVSIVHLSFVF